MISFHNTMIILLTTIILLCYLCVQNRMFEGASTFNQDIGNWNVSSGTDFVSIVMNTKVSMYESNHLTHVITLPDLFLP